MSTVKQPDTTATEEPVTEEASAPVDYSDPPYWSRQGWTGAHDVADYERELRRLADTLDRANALLAEAADEAKRLQNRIDQLEAERKDRAP